MREAGSEARDLLEFTGGDAGDDGFAAEGVGEDAFAIEPVFHLLALDADAGLVPLAWAAREGVGSDGKHVVEGGGGVFEILAGFGVGGGPEQLVFVADGGIALFVDEVFHPGIAAGVDAPFEGEVVVKEQLRGHEVTATRLAEMPEAAVSDRPSLGWEGVLFERAPTLGGGAVEEEAPAVGFFAVRQGIGRFGGERRGGQKSDT